VSSTARVSGRPVDLGVVQSAELDAPTRDRLRGLWDAAFGDRFSAADAEHAYGGVHVVAHDGRELVAHASAVPRRIGFGEEWREIGYVEAVATAPSHQGRGVGTLVMRLLHDEIARRWPVAMLSTGRATGFYERLGWERWRGASFTRTAGGVVADGDHGGLMILRFDASAVPDLSVDVTCEDRSGDAW
jgi:aminoglycoside 2'-N-acetyltransferase I